MFDLQGIEKGEFLTYKGRALVRNSDDVVYGDPMGKAHVKMMIMAKSGESEVPSLIVVQLFEKGNPMPTRQFPAKSFADAIDTAAVWLDGVEK